MNCVDNINQEKFNLNKKKEGLEGRSKNPPKKRLHNSLPDPFFWEIFMSKDPAVLFYTSDFLVGTLTMTNEEVGMYIKLLCLQHQKGFLTEADMLNICKAPVDSIFHKFIKEDGIYYNKRMRLEAKKRAKYSISRKNNALKSNLTNSKQSSNSKKHMQSICKTYAKHMENENVNVNENININKDINNIKDTSNNINLNNTNNTNDNVNVNTNNTNVNVTNNVINKNNTKEILSFFYEKYKEILGKDYISAFAKDGAIMKGLLKIIPIDELKRLIEVYLTLPDEFCEKNGYSIGLFKSRINSLRIEKRTLQVSEKTLKSMMAAKQWLEEKEKEEKKDAG